MTDNRSVSIMDMVEQWLTQNGYDGLCEPDSECGCQLQDLMPCGYPSLNCCMPGYARYDSGGSLIGIYREKEGIETGKVKNEAN